MKIALFHNEMISAEILLGNVLLGGELKIDTNNSTVRGYFRDEKREKKSSLHHMFFFVFFFQLKRYSPNLQNDANFEPTSSFAL